MSKFAVLFPNYADNAAYLAVRNKMLQEGENRPLYLGGSNLPAAGKYGKPGNLDYTIGYGYDISKQTGAGIIADFTAAGIAISDAKTNNVGGVLYSTRDRRINQPRVCNKSTLFPLHGTRGCAISGRVRTRNIFATALAA
ncbi:MAG: hypothetical protein IPI58_00850 [Alphaproteobacteria bacterium]|nr:MAG: hypothetical protein IPI58_00850 [Alphaproteobacteria bacterium]